MKQYVRNYGAGILMCAAALVIVVGGVHVVVAATDINSTNRYAWNDLIGWLDFYAENTVKVNSQNLRGYATSTVGDVSLDCHTTRSGNICAQSDYQILNDGIGNLNGFAWNDQYGWISFCGTQNAQAATTNCPLTSSTYEVLIDANDGLFSGYAWNDTAGWISFNCTNNNGCGESDYKVQTSWVATSAIATLDSATYDTGVSGGAQINSVLWHGTQPSETQVRFQFATSNSSSGPWSYAGSDGTSSTYYTTGPDVSKRIDYTLHSGKRYFRYRITLISNRAQTTSATVTEVVINWSP
ncbi:MAG: hypothetical protein HYW65_03440 [Candidatus Liptonbacteria bacterium]|nr:hypothetical protein [Candidatus Liptonbacteria bacterium]